MEEETNEVKESGIDASIKIKKSNPWIAISIALLIIVAALAYTVFRAGEPTGLTKEQALAKTIDYINLNLLPANITATPMGAEEVSGVYIISIQVNDQTFNSYVTKDGRYLFTQGLDMTIPVPKPQAVQPAEITEPTPGADVSPPQVANGTS